jgi:hypothetical protein
MGREKLHRRKARKRIYLHGKRKRTLGVDELRDNILFTEMERENSWQGDEREKKSWR